MKRGLVGIIILSILVVLVLSAVGAGIYFYKFYVFKELRACVGNWEDTTFPCGSRKDCLTGFNFSDEKLEGAPDFVVQNFNAILNSLVYCDGTCYVGAVRGVNYETGEVEGVDSCLEGEDEFVVEIRGKEGLEILRWIKNQGLLED